MPNIKKQHKVYQKKLSKMHRSPVFRRLVVVLLITIFLYFVYCLLSTDKVLFNTNIGSVNIGGVKKSEAKVIIADRLKAFEEQKLSFVLGERVVDVSASDLGISFSTDLTLNKVYVLGKPGHLFGDLYLNFASLFRLNKVEPVYSLNVDRLQEFVGNNFADLEEPVVNAKIVNFDGKLTVEKNRDGKVIDSASLVSDVLKRLDILDHSPVYLGLVSKEAEVKAELLQNVFEKYKSILSKKVLLTYDINSFRLEGQELLDMVSVSRSGYKNGYLLALNGLNAQSVVLNAQAPGVEHEIDIALDDQKVLGFLEKISKVIDRPTVNATASFENGKVVQFVSAVDGREMDVNKTKELVLNSLINENNSTLQDITIKVPVNVTSAKVANEKINQLGIKELIGKGVSYFAGSIANRIYNIQLGASRINGTLVAPGDVFSFNGSVGEVSGKTGYKQAYVISSGRTVLDDGGGICQVSTTVFRAALNSGLPIVSRTAHAYRVGYYEQRGVGPGFDATVFAPSVDFKFKNDTENYILVQTLFDRANLMLEVDVYGTKDGRSVELSKSVVSNIKPAPEDKYQDDPTLPKGTKKQVDFAASGADAYFTRKVYKNGSILSDDVFKSHYQPWQAIYLVGTGA